MKISFHTLGCKLNFAETSAIARQLLEDGHTKAGKGEKADLCIINTCSVTDAADHKDRQAINRIHRENPDAIIVVTGCYAQLQPEHIAHIEGVDYVLGQNDKFHLTALVRHLEEQASLPQVQWTPMQQLQDYHPSYSKDDRTRCFLKIQDGCDYFCTYCTIPYARGRSRNASIEQTMTQVRHALSEGNREIILTGVNIGDFGKSTSETFFDLLQHIDDLDGLFRVRISSIEPNLLSDDIIDFVAHSRHFAPHFHIPLQSGSNQVLEIMHRRYTRELFQERVEHIKAVMPDAFIGVDCMVGVRGETEDCFADYYQFVEALPVSQLHVFTYSEREGTRMLRMPLHVVEQKERKKRSDIMHRLSEQKLEAFYQSQKGTTHTVLWESKREGTLMSGFTENYVRVFRDYDKNRINTFETIEVGSLDHNAVSR